MSDDDDDIEVWDADEFETAVDLLVHVGQRKRDPACVQFIVFDQSGILHFSRDDAGEWQETIQRPRRDA